MSSKKAILRDSDQVITKVWLRHYTIGLIQERLGELSTAHDSFVLSLQISKDVGALSRQVAPAVQLAALAYRGGEPTRATEYIMLIREVAAKSKQYSLAANLYKDVARHEASLQHYMNAFQWYAEALCIARNENDDIFARIFDECTALLKEIYDSQNRAMAYDIAQKLLAFWQKHCVVTPEQSAPWSLLTSPFAQMAARDGEEALKFLLSAKNNFLG